MRKHPSIHLTRRVLRRYKSSLKDMKTRKITSRLSLLLFATIAMAQQPEGPAIKAIPPAGVEIPAQDRTELEAGLKRLRASIDKLAGNPLLPDVLIYHEAVRYALQYNEFFKLDEIAKAWISLCLPTTAAQARSCWRDSLMRTGVSKTRCVRSVAVIVGQRWRSEFHPLPCVGFQAGSEQ
jgi:hypothetical protein